MKDKISTMLDRMIRVVTLALFAIMVVIVGFAVSCGLLMPQYFYSNVIWPYEFIFWSGWIIVHILQGIVYIINKGES